MSFISILETLLIGPLKLIFEIIFEFANRFVGHPGLAIIFLSLIMNILVLPLYKRADAMQEASRDIEARLHDGVAHIKKTFSGDERMMILQTYYRQNHYKPTDALNGSVSLLLEIPFFMAAYQFLSHLDILNGVSFGPIKDLGAPDGLIVIGGIAINLLPILMTLINIISSALYLKGFPLKTKIQLYAMAMFFLVFLYTSPACLVFYWTLNNVFSLVKNIFYKIKNPQKVLRILTCIVGLALLGYGLFVFDLPSVRKKSFLIGVGLLLQLPLLLPIIKSKLPSKNIAVQSQSNRKIFFLGAVLLTVLVGLLIPSAFISASPQEYVDITYFHNPLWYIVSALSLSAGTFLVWMGVFYWLASPNGKAIFDKLIWILCGVALVNYMFFGTKLGNMSSILQYDNGMAFSISEQLINVAVIIALAAVMYLIATKLKKVVPIVLLTAIIALGGMSAVNIAAINGSVSDFSETQRSQESGIPNFELSKTGNNVVVIMMDRAMGEYVPYIFNEKPELREQFDGFTHYANTISYAGKTNMAVPALLGGYEYTPVEINKRDEELLVEKHNEALKVMPVLFSENGFDVTVCDPVYANYQWIPDVTIYDEYEGIDSYVTKGFFGDTKQKQRVIDNNHRNFFCFSIMKSMPLFLQTTVYNNGLYNQISSQIEETTYSTQTQESMSTATGLFASFMESYNVLGNMPNMTNVTNNEKGAFLFLSNDLTHEPMLLQTPDYTPSETVDNTEYDAANTDRFIVDGRELKMESTTQMIHYHANMATFIQLGKWFDYLRENDIYDNTRIILVADHGQFQQQIDELILDDGSDLLKNVEYYYPLLMVKDFNSTGFTTSYDFMTNADVPTLATDGVIENPVNPFTGKPINSDEKTAHDQLIMMSLDWDTKVNNGKTFTASRWASVSENLWDAENWEFYDKSVILKKHELPEDPAKPPKPPRKD